MQAYGNLFQGRQIFTLATGRHALKRRIRGAAQPRHHLLRHQPQRRIRLRRRHRLFAAEASRPRAEPTTSIAGDPLPDTLSSLLSGSPFRLYARHRASLFLQRRAHWPRGHQSQWFQPSSPRTPGRSSPRLALDYGLRYELYTPITERAKRTSGIGFTTTPSGVEQRFLINPQPGYRFNLDGLDPRIQLDWLAAHQVHLRAGGAITTIPPNLYQDNFLTGSTPFVIYPRLTSAAAAPISYGFQITPNELPQVYTPAGTVNFR